jgi:pyruvate dehydrogenase E2 component (dihydrolipoamide acetyltransferase)
MPVPVIMPKLEMSQETAFIIEWLKKEGEPVKQGEALLTVETDKLTMDIESTGSGVLSGVSAKAGETVPVTTVIAYLLQPGETWTGPGKSEGKPPEKDPQKAPTAPAPKPAAPAAASPVAQRMAAEQGIDLSALTGSGPQGRITKNDVASVLGKAPAAPVPQGKVRATPAARRVSKEMNLELNQVTGSGPRGRIQAEDVMSHTPAATQVPSTQQTAQLPVEAEEEIIPLAGMRKTIAERMQNSYQTAPHITFTARVDMTEFEALRARLNKKTAERSTAHISVTALLVKVISWVLPQFPWMNSSLQNEQLHVYKQIHIGMAVALKDGLIVPVLHNAGQKGLAEIAREVKDLADRAQQGKLVPTDVSRGTFTISNLGPYGIEQFTAILSPGQAGILAVGAVIKEPVVIDDAVAIRPMMHITLSADHRVVDGALAAQFIAALKEVLEDPALVIL